MGKSLDVVAPIAGAILGSFVPGLGTGVGAALGGGLASGGVNYSQTHNIGNALTAGALGGAGSYLGGNLGNAIAPATSGSIADVLGAGLTPDVGSVVGSLLPGSAYTAGLGQIGGSLAGSQIASNFAPQGQPSNRGNYPFVPQQQGQMDLPVSLGGSTGPSGAPGTSPGINNLSSLTPSQQASSLATQGVYGGGNGPQEQAYYGNLLNRQLVGNGGGVSPLSTLSPIEQSYNSKLGFGGATDSNNLLEMLSKWNPANA